MEVFPYPYNIGKKAYLGTNESTRVERSELSEYNTDRGVTITGSNTGSYSFEVHGNTPSDRTSSNWMFLACSVSTRSYLLSFNSAKSSAHENQIVVRDPSTGNITYERTRTIPRTQRKDDWNGVPILYDLVELRGGDSLEINLELRSTGFGRPTLYYVFFTGARFFQYDGFTSIEPEQIDPGLIVRPNLYGGLSKKRLVNARRRWRINYEVFVSANSPLQFNQWHNFLENRNESDRFLFSESFEQYPMLTFPAAVVNITNPFTVLNPTKTAFNFPLRIEEI